MRRAILLSAAVATLALGACSPRQEMVAADAAPSDLPAGALDAISPETRPAAFGIPDAKLPRDTVPPSKL